MDFKLFLLLLFLSLPVRADPLDIEAIPPGEDEIVYLPQGGEAPYSGQLYSNDTAIRWAHWLLQLEQRWRLDVQLAEQQCVAEIDFQKHRYVVEENRAKKVEEDMSSRILKLEKLNVELEESIRNPPWYKRPVFYISVGAVGTFGVTATVLLLAKSSTK